MDIKIISIQNPLPDIFGLIHKIEKKNIIIKKKTKTNRWKSHRLKKKLPMSKKPKRFYVSELIYKKIRTEYIHTQKEIKIKNIVKNSKKELPSPNMPLPTLQQAHGIHICFWHNLQFKKIDSSHRNKIGREHNYNRYFLTPHSI